MNDKALTFNELFDADFLSSLQRFSLQAQRVVRGGRSAEHPSKALGHGLEFKDFRPYSPGDDLRSIDWNIYQRLGKLFVKVFEEQQDLPLYLLMDVSASAFLEQPPRIHAALRAALALASVSLNQHDSVGLFPFGSDLQIKVKSQAGKSSLARFAQHLADLESGDQTDLGAAMRKFSGLSLRRGLLVIISDFFDPGGVQAITSALKDCRHRLLFVQLVRQSDRDPDLQGELRLRDCETGAATDVTVTPQVLRRYRQAYQRFNDALAAEARKRHAGLLRLDVEQDVVSQLSSLFAGGSLRV